MKRLILILFLFLANQVTSQVEIEEVYEKDTLIVMDDTLNKRIICYNKQKVIVREIRYDSIEKDNPVWCFNYYSDNYIMVANAATGMLGILDKRVNISYNIPMYQRSLFIYKDL